MPPNPPTTTTDPNTHTVESFMALLSEMYPSPELQLLREMSGSSETSRFGFLHM